MSSWLVPLYAGLCLIVFWAFWVADNNEPRPPRY